MKYILIQKKFHCHKYLRISFSFKDFSLFSYLQVALPALNISLGTFLKFFNILEAKCYQLDFQLAALSGCGNGLSQEQVDSMIRAFEEIRQLQKEIQDVENTITLVYQAIAENISRNAENEEQIKATYEPRLVYLSKKIETKVKSYSK